MADDQISKLLQQKKFLHDKLVRLSIEYSRSKTPRLFDELNQQILEKLKTILLQTKDKQKNNQELGYQKLNDFFLNCDYKISDFELKGIAREKRADFTPEYLIIAGNYLFKNFDKNIFCRKLYDNYKNSTSQENIYDFFNNCIDYMIIDKDHYLTQNQYAFDVQYNYLLALFKGGMELDDQFNLFPNQKITIKQFFDIYKKAHPLFIEELISTIEEIKIEKSLNNNQSTKKSKNFKL